MILIWDFNGTILDDVGIGIESINALLSRRSLPTIGCRADYHKVFRFPIIDYYADLGLDVGDYDALAHEWVAEYKSRMPHAPMLPGIPETLEAVQNMGIRQVILSATEQGQLNEQVRGLGIEGYFDEILGTGNIYAYSKIDTALAFRARHPEPMLLVGDTDHDLQTAEALGVDCVLIPCGHQSRETLAGLGCRMIDHPTDLIPLLSAWEKEI